MSLSSPTARGESTTLAFSPSALEGVRFQTVNSCPESIRLAAIPRPMIPSPMNPSVVMELNPRRLLARARPPPLVGIPGVDVLNRSHGT